MPSRNILDPIPHPPKTFLVGNLLALGATTPVQDMMKLARQYGPIYWLDMMGKPVIVVYDGSATRPYTTSGDSNAAYVAALAQTVPVL